MKKEKNPSKVWKETQILGGQDSDTETGFMLLLYLYIFVFLTYVVVCVSLEADSVSIFCWNIKGCIPSKSCFTSLWYVTNVSSFPKKTTPI